MHISISGALFYSTYLRITLYPLQALPYIIQRLRIDVLIPKNSAAFVMCFHPKCRFKISFFLFCVPIYLVR